MKPDLIAILEAAYRVGADETSWLAGVREIATPALDRGMGVSAFLYDARDVHKLRVWSFLGSGDDRVAQAIERTTPNRVRWVFRAHACRAASDGPDWESQPAAKLFRSLGFNDVLFVNGVDPSGLGCFLTARLKEKQSAPRATVLQWSFIAAHLAAGYRLQRRAMEPANSIANADAVLTPRGRLEHASSDVASSRRAREVLREAAIAMDRSRGKARRVAPSAAVAGWPALVDTRWSLLDHFDRDGRRYVIACANDPNTPVVESLTVRERQVLSYALLGHANKLIAYELGITPSTVGVLFSRASKKLRTTSRPATIEAFRRLTDQTI